MNHTPPLAIDEKTAETIGLIVHSYNNYLSGAIGFTELSLLDPVSEECAEKLELSLQSSRQAVEFGKQLLAAAGRLQVAFTPIDLFSMIENFAKDKVIELKSQNNTKKTHVETNAQSFIKCLTELIDFIKSYSPNSEIAFNWQRSKSNGIELGTLRVSATDMSLTQEQNENLFNPFYSSRQLLGGSGIGLAQVRGFLTQMKASIVWDNHLGFVIELPLVDS